MGFAPENLKFEREDWSLFRTVEGLQPLKGRNMLQRDECIRRVVLCHATEKGRFTLTCATENALESSCPHSYKVVHTADFGQVAFTIEAQPGCPIQLTKYIVYHTSHTACAEELCGRAEWTLDRVVSQGFRQLLAAQERYMHDFWRRSDVRIKDIKQDRMKRSTVEIQGCGATDGPGDSM